MRVFECKFTNDEIVSDVFAMEYLYDNTIIKVQSKLVPKDDLSNVNVGNCNHFGGAEEEDNEGEPVEKELDTILNFNLVENNLTTADFKDWLKVYIPSLSKKLKAEKKDDRVEVFKNGMKNFCKEVIFPRLEANEVQFYLGKSEVLGEAAIAMAIWEDDGASGPVFYYVADGLNSIKC